jgi:RND family efflux transporter MFP subunit
MKFITKIKRFFLSKTGISIVIILIGAGVFFFIQNKNPEQNIFTLTSDNLATSGITVGGTVVAQKEVNLSFEESGRVAYVSKNAGDRVSQGETIASLDTGIISANILKAQADFDGEVAKLDEYKSQEGSGLTEVESNKDQLVRQIKNSYIVAEDSILNKTDQFFEDGDSRFPEIFYIFDDRKLSSVINDERYKIGLLLKTWRTWSTGITEKTYTEKDIIQTKNNITQIQQYLNLVASAVNTFEANELHSQTSIDKYKSDTSTARANMNTILNELITAQEALRSTTSQIPYQEARVKSARATILNYQAQLQKSIIRAPFTGLITKQDAKVGMSIFGDQSLVSMISDSNYGLDTYVPEIYVSQIKVGNKAKVTLNSYGSIEEFDATVTYIDPAASPRDGVASYKVQLIFDQNDERIKSGMTGDVEIMTEVANPTFTVPVLAVIDQGGASYVKVKNGDIIELRKVQIGERNPTEIEILSGLLVGDQLVLENAK